MADTNLTPEAVAAMEAALAAHRADQAKQQQMLLVHPGDIIQITDAAAAWHPTLLVVEESKKWGVMAFAFVPRNGGIPGQAYHRLQWGTFQKVGECAVLPADLLAARRDSIETARLVAEEAKAAGQ